MYSKISNNFTEFTPTNKYVDFFFFSFWCYNGEICYSASKHTHAICWVRRRQFLRTIKFSSGCSARESHNPPSCEKKEILFILFPSSLPDANLSFSQLSALHHLAPFTLSLSLYFLGSPSALTILPISISFRGSVRHGPGRHPLL